MYRTHHCNQLRRENIDQKVVLSGWVHRRRDHGGLIFVDLRDRYGLTQVVFDPKVNEEAWHQAEQIRPEYVIRVEGLVRYRGEGVENPKLETGAIEIESSAIKILNKSQTPPFEIEQETDVGEELRMKYRYLDLRRERMRENMIMRHKITNHIRSFLDKKNFLDIETPILIKGTPEGSREYIVPSRLHHGNFYVLPQSPQQLKQLLMISGMDRYYQIARCFRDEDQRGDRQPEFTQLDMELSFVTQEEIMELNSELLLDLCQTLYPQKKIRELPIPRLTWQQAMDEYGSDKPDLRFDLKILDLSSEMANTEFKVFSGAISSGGVVRALRVPEGGKFSRREIDELEEIAKIYGARGLAYILYSAEEGPKSPLLKFLSEDDQKIIQEKTGAETGDIVFFGAGDYKTVCESLGAVRLEMGKKLKLINQDELSFVWIYDFPMFEIGKESGQLEAVHHLFTRPLERDIDLIDTEPEEVLSAAYDLVINGSEIGGGSMRIHEGDLQAKVFKALKISSEDAEYRFGHMLDAFKYGVPPHGGIAWGLDRFVMIMQNEPNIREVMAFPKDQKAKDLMLGAPSVVKNEELKELGIMINVEES